ncbi:DUF2835 domain-containing protein [Saccharobesus litoralis]|uniref:DUF2835 domain-containing protein n=1 Tax=Saccharobesus litoralis TaxID=2172099 RepID=A0A2S0VUF8_9ALTE|nr:DUF2835 family protein [Saccharobesus litoralis]AWB67730.1 DUF2835 domain-containing protein [Saccharobesus litoralis]
MSQVYFFSLDVPPQQCEELYTGVHRTVTATAHNGLRVQIPIANLRRFVTQMGIKGVFRLITDDNNKIQSFERVQ